MEFSRFGRANGGAMFVREYAVCAGGATTPSPQRLLYRSVARDRPFESASQPGRSR